MRFTMVTETGMPSFKTGWKKAWVEVAHPEALGLSEEVLEALFPDVLQLGPDYARVQQLRRVVLEQEGLGREERDLLVYQAPRSKEAADGFQALLEWGIDAKQHGVKLLPHSWATENTAEDIQAGKGMYVLETLMALQRMLGPTAARELGCFVPWANTVLQRWNLPPLGGVFAGRK